MRMIIYCAVLISSSGNLFAQASDQLIAQELVGKWCFINLALTTDQITNSCITLNSDGTFEAILDRSTIPSKSSFPYTQDTDSGKWWVKDSRLFYSSSTNGQGSFSLQKVNHPRLENTPMLVLNGIAFATSSPKDPW